MTDHTLLNGITKAVHHIEDEIGSLKDFGVRVLDNVKRLEDDQSFKDVTHGFVEMLCHVGIVKSKLSLILTTIEEVKTIHNQMTQLALEFEEVKEGKESVATLIAHIMADVQTDIALIANPPTPADPIAALEDEVKAFVSDEPGTSAATS